MRGEYHTPRPKSNPHPELPPRARRIHGVLQAPVVVLGTTSACAENTVRALAFPLSAWNYLRVRGEYMLQIRVRVVDKELPPRARRIPSGVFCPSSGLGTTSACAENTTEISELASSVWNYLRVRGEYGRVVSSALPGMELPPRARRILFLTPGGFLQIGTTSACAENMPLKPPLSKGKRNYLRVRGEYTRSPAPQRRQPELPPRARRIP